MFVLAGMLLTYICELNYISFFLHTKPLYICWFTQVGAMSYFIALVIEFMWYHFMSAVICSNVDHSWTIMMQGATIG